MKDAASVPVVAVAPGTGRIARRAQVLLFDPTGDNTDLITGFDAAPDDEAAITSVKQHLIDREFQVAPLVVIDWRGDGLGLVVFGDADVMSSAPAAPMISGAGSGTWIERQVGALELGDAAEAQVWCGDDTDDVTDLRLGVVRAGGVRVTVPRAATAPVSAPAEIPPQSEEPTNPRPVPAPVPPAPVAAPPAMNGSAAPIAEPGYVAPPEQLDWADTDGAPAAGAVATAAPPDPFGDAPAPAAVAAPVSQGAAPAPVAAPEPVIDLDAAEAVVEPAGTGLVEATLCSNGHSNPPRTSICRVCAVEIDPDAEVTLIAQPSVGHLRFADGNAVEVDRELIVGRKPSAEASQHPVVVDHAEVSRSHVQVSLEGWAVLATDLGSRNGTWVIPPSDPTPIKLDASVPYLLEHGTTVHMGGPDASFTYDFGTD